MELLRWIVSIALAMAALPGVLFGWGVLVRILFYALSSTKEGKGYSFSLVMPFVGPVKE